MRFLAVMGVAPKVVAWLRQQGHDVWHLAERGLERLPDPDIFARAAEENRIVLTFDLDFGEILALSGGTTSVILLALLNLVWVEDAPGGRPHPMPGMAYGRRGKPRPPASRLTAPPTGPTATTSTIRRHGA